MKVSLINILLGLVVVYVLYRMFFAREHNTNKTAMDAIGWTIASIGMIVILATLGYLLYDFFVLKKIHYY